MTLCMYVRALQNVRKMDLWKNGKRNKKPQRQKNEKRKVYQQLNLCRILSICMCLRCAVHNV